MDEKRSEENIKSEEPPKSVSGEAVDIGKAVLAEGFKKTVEAEKGGLEVVGKVTGKPVKHAREFWRGLGPGLITGAADDDPSGIATYSQTGAKYGFQLLWLAWLTFPLMAIVQEMCARIGLVTGRGLAHNIKQYFPNWVIYISAILLFSANSFNIGADLGGMAKATQLLFPGLPFWLLIFGFVIFSLILVIFVSYKHYARYLKYLALVLFVYVITAFVIKDFNWLGVLRSAVIPSLTFSKEQIILICAALGTTISPYLFFWQTSQEIEEEIMDGQTTLQERQQTDKKQVRKMRTDVWSGMLLSNLVMFFIIAVCGSVLFSNGVTNINTAADAAAALKPLAGSYASLLFALGVIGVGLLGIPILAGSASYAVSESFGWKEGLYRRFKEAGLFYGGIILSMIIGLIINFIGIDPIKALIYAAVFNGIIAPVILVFIVLLSSNRKIMGEWTNRPLTTILGWVATLLMAVVSIATVISFF